MMKKIYSTIILGLLAVYSAMALDESDVNCYDVLGVALGSVIITEVYYDSYKREDMAAPIHHRGEYVELYNTTNTEISLANWVIKDNHTKFYFPSNAVIPPNGYVIYTYGSSSDPSEYSFQTMHGTSSYNNVHIYKSSGIGKPILNNTGDYVELYNNAGAIMDYVGFGVQFRGETWNVTARNSQKSPNSIQRVNAQSIVQGMTISQISDPSFYQKLSKTPFGLPQTGQAPTLSANNKTICGNASTFGLSASSTNNGYQSTSYQWYTSSSMTSVWKSGSNVTGDASMITGSSKDFWVKGTNTYGLSSSKKVTVTKSASPTLLEDQYFVIESDDSRIIVPAGLQQNETMEYYLNGTYMEEGVLNIDLTEYSAGIYTFEVYTILAQMCVTNIAAIIEVEIKEQKSIDVTNIFAYKYDHRNRMVEKQVPGADPVYMVYDNRDRLVLTQDANQRESSQWLFTKYDALNRPVATGIYTDATNTTRDDMQTYVNGEVGTNTTWFEQLGTAIARYDNSSFPTIPLESDYLTVTYYDNYTASVTWAMDYVDAQLTQTTNDDYTTDEAHNDKVKGQVTASMVKNLEDNTWLETTVYYDDKYRVIQTVAKNHLGGLDRTSSLYDFVGKVLETISEHDDTDNINTIDETFTYDHAGRLMNIKQTLNSEDKVVVLANEYNELGELIEKNLHGTPDPDDPEITLYEQSVDYRYNIRGWLTSINDSNLSSEGQAEVVADDYFGMELLYNNEEILLGNKGLFNGNISAVKWNYNMIDAPKQAYTYTYDAMNRITAANSKTTAAWIDGSTDMSVGEYDLNGNIKSLTRGTLGGEIDLLTYNYGAGTTLSNQLLSVSDASGNAEGFKDGNAGSDDYSYDANGNMTADKNKAIALIEYNHLNLPNKVTKNEGQYIKYIYDAVGIKLAQEVYDKDGALQKRTDYSGAYIYESTGTDPSELQFIQTSEGRIIVSDVSSEYQYHLKDHLGNTRVTFTTNENVDTYLATIEEEYRAYETSVFDNVDETESHKQEFNHTPSDENVAIPAYSSILFNNKPDYNDQTVGPAISIKVDRGDKVDIESYAQYVGYTGDGSKVAGNALLGAVASAFTPINATAEVVQQIIDQFAAAGVGATSPGAEEDAPAAFLTFLLFDKDFNPVALLDGGAGFDGVTTNADGAFEKLEIPTVEITESGYMYIYVSNEDVANVNVHFDDLRITHTKSKIVQMDDYYPFGLTFNSFKREDGKVNDFLYNGKEMQDELDIGWMDYGARMYDAAIGRFNHIDPMADSRNWLSPYNYVQNNPIMRIDPNGMLDDDYKIHANGDIVRNKTDDKTDSFTYVDSDGTEHNIGTYAKNENNLIQLGDVNYSSGDVSVNITAKPGNASELNVSGSGMASLIGASANSGEELYVTRASNSDGTSPGDSESHVNGNNLDIRFAQNNGSRSSLNYNGNLSNFNKIDQTASASMNAGLKKFGWKSIKASTLTITNTSIINGVSTPSSSSYSISGTSNLTNHYDHQHLQGYNPTIQTRTRPSAVSTRKVTSIPSMR